MKTDFNSSEILLTFALSTTGKRYMNIVNDEKETAIYLITPATFEAVKADRIKSLTFSKNVTPLPRPSDAPAGSTQQQIDRVKQQQDAYDKGIFTYSWAPVEMVETELVDLERQSKTIGFRVTIAKGSIDLRELEKQLA